MNKTNVILLSLILMMVIGTIIYLAIPASAQLIYKVNQVIDLKIPCSLDGYPCTSSGLCNISSQYPNSSFLINNKAMNYLGGGFFNYTLISAISGEYPTTVYCTQNGQNNTLTFPLIINPTGSEQSSSQGMASAGFLFLMLFLTFIFGYLGFKLSESDYLWVLGIFFLFLAVMMMLYDVWLGYEFHLNYSGINDGSKVPEIIFYIFCFVLVSGLITSAALLFTKWKKVKEYFRKAKEEEESYEREDDWE